MLALLNTLTVAITMDDAIAPRWNFADSNHDGVLDTSEAAVLMSVLNASCAGDLEPYSADDDTWVCDGSSLVYGSSIKVVMGDLSASGSDVTSLSLPSLRNVTGDVTISDNYDLTEASLPAPNSWGDALRALQPFWRLERRADPARTVKMNKCALGDADLWGSNP